MHISTHFAIHGLSVFQWISLRKAEGPDIELSLKLCCSNVEIQADIIFVDSIVDTIKGKCIYRDWCYY